MRAKPWIVVLLGAAAAGCWGEVEQGEGWDQAANGTTNLANVAEGPLVEECGAPLDTNGNGIVEEAEYFSFGQFAFVNWDDDGDLALSAAEFGRCWGALGWGDFATAFRAFDSDGDGSLSREEFFRREQLNQWDDDKDSRLGAGEWPPS